MKHKDHKGFTLIELMIVVAIIAILAAVAFPSYTEHILKGRRADGKNMLLQLSALQERFYSENGFYGRMTDIVGTATFDSDEGYYNIAVNCAPDSATCATASRPQVYLLTATRQAGQTGDVRCGDFTYNQSATRGIINQSAGVVAAACW